MGVGVGVGMGVRMGVRMGVGIRSWRNGIGNGVVGKGKKGNQVCGRLKLT